MLGWLSEGKGGGMGDLLEEAGGREDGLEHPRNSPCEGEPHCPPIPGKATELISK